MHRHANFLFLETRCVPGLITVGSINMGSTIISNMTATGILQMTRYSQLYKQNKICRVKFVIISESVLVAVAM